MTYGYARIFTKTHKIERQIKNLQAYDKDIIIYQEAYTGATHIRPEWTKLQKKLKNRDTLIFYSVSRMSRDAKEGTKKYFQLREKGINLVFLKERHIDTEAYERTLNQAVDIDSGLRYSLRPHKRYPRSSRKVSGNQSHR